jgi:hypothetical protein
MSRAQSVQISSTDSAMRDLNINIDVLEWLGLEFLPHQLTLGRIGIEAHPSFELVIFCSHDTIGEDEEALTPKGKFDEEYGNGKG